MFPDLVLLNVSNSEDHEIFFIEFSCPRKEREFYTEFIKNEIDFIDVKKFV